jgi:uncharacterized RDD family membrane protein YckC
MRYDNAYATPHDAHVLVRILAYMIDFVLVTIVVTAMLFVYVEVINPQDVALKYRHDLASLRNFMVPISFLTYFVAFEAGTGATLGKMFVGVRVVREDGAPVGPLTVLFRNLLRQVTLFFPFLLLVPLLSKRRQMVHDMLTDCVVVRN